MGERTQIAWTGTKRADGGVEADGYTFNPWIGCHKVSPACESCYAEVSTATRSTSARIGLKLWGPPKTSARYRTSVGNWREPAKWDRKAKAEGVRRKVFCASLADVFEANEALDPYRADLWPMMEKCDGLDWLVLTKRPGNVRAMVPPAWLTSWPAHVWVGTTVEDQRRAAERIPLLLDVPARVRFLSCEPLLEPVDLEPWLRRVATSGPGWRMTGGSAMAIADIVLDLVIVGGESGPGARPCDLAWIRGIVGQCKAPGCPCL